MMEAAPDAINIQDLTPVEPHDVLASAGAICPVCDDVVVSPVHVFPCLHVFCDACISSWSSIKPNCPVCRCVLEFDKHGKNKVIRKAIARATISLVDVTYFFCPNRPTVGTSGCSSKIMFKDIGEHLKNCAHQTVKCLFDGCNFQGTPATVLSHAKGCSFRGSLKECPFDCGYTTTTAIKTHISGCPNNPSNKRTTCPHGCGYEARPLDMLHHTIRCNERQSVAVAHGLVACPLCAAPQYDLVDHFRRSHTMITSINKELDLAVRQQYHFSPASSTCAKSMLIALMSAWTTGYRNFDPNRFFNSLGGVRNAYNANKFSHASTFKAELEALLALVVASKLFTFNQEQRAAIWQRELNPTSHPIDYEPYDGEYEATALNRILTRALEIREHNEYDTDFEYDSETWHYI